MTYLPASDRYDKLDYRQTGRSGLKLPPISFGLWHNFGENALPERARTMLHTAFDHGITHFDLANNYGPPPGAAETFFGSVLATDFRAYRDELVISTKAGYRMWPGPYGEWGSRKYLLVEPRPEPQADGARLCRHLLLAPGRPQHAARGDDGRARHGGAPGQGALRRHLLLQRQAHARRRRRSSATSARRSSSTSRAIRCSTAGSRRTSSSTRWRRRGRAASSSRRWRRACSPTSISRACPPTAARRAAPAPGGRASCREENLAAIRGLHGIAERRGQTLAQMAIAWVLRDKRVTTALIGASRPEQIVDAVGALAQARLRSGRTRRDRPLRAPRAGSTSGGCRRRRDERRGRNRLGARVDRERQPYRGFTCQDRPAAGRVAWPRPQSVGVAGA